MLYKKLIIIFLFLIFSHTFIYAVPAMTDIDKFTQPDGTNFNARQRGDEWLNWCETEDGYTIIKNTSTGWWYYAKADENEGISKSKYLVGEINPEKINLKKGIRPAGRKNLSVFKKSIKSRKLTSPILPHDQKLLVVLIEFNDRSNDDKNSSESFRDAIFLSTKKSIADYYKEVSFGKFNILPAEESFGEKDDGIVGWMKLNQNHPDCGSNYECVRDVMQSVMQNIDQYVNFSLFDKNTDGNITPDELSILVIFAGYENAYDKSKPGIWAHRWHLENPLTLDGRLIKDYAAAGEMHKDHRATIGAIVHELGHLMLELPDLYDTDGTSMGIGIFDLMAYGAWGKSNTDDYNGDSPVHLSAWSKIYSGFIDPTIVNKSNVTFPIASENPEAIKILTSDSYQYFLLEYRYPSGYDSGLKRIDPEFKGGIAIWHIDESLLLSDCIFFNNCNDDENHKLVDLEEADGSQNLDAKEYYGASQDLFYKGNNNRFDNTSNPNSRLYSNEFSYISVSNISIPEITMSAMIGESELPLTPVIKVNLTSIEFEKTEVGKTSEELLKISNTGLSDLKINEIKLSGTYSNNFSYSLLEDTVAPNKSTTLTVKFSPVTTDIISADLFISSNDSDNEIIRITLHGTGLPSTKKDKKKICLISKFLTGSIIQQIGNFKDKYLLETFFGRNPIEWYYKHAVSTAGSMALTLNILLN